MAASIRILDLLNVLLGLKKSPIPLVETPQDPLKDIIDGSSHINIDTEPAAVFRKIYDNMAEYVEPQSIPQLVLILADYQYKNAFVADHELNIVACCTEIMAGVKFK